VAVFLTGTPAGLALAQNASSSAAPGAPANQTIVHDRKAHPAQGNEVSANLPSAAGRPSSPSSARVSPAASLPAPGRAPAAYSAAVATPAAAAGGAEFNTEAPKDQAIHMIVGRSVFLTTKHRLSRVYITNPAVLESYTASANQVVLTSKAPGISSVILWDEAGDQQDYLVSAETDVEMLRKSLQEAMPNDPIRVEQSQGRIMITGTVGTQADSDAALKLASAYSKDVSNALLIDSAKVPQVELKVRVLEVDRTRANQFAFNFFNGGGNNIAQTTTGQFASSPSVQNGGTNCPANSTTCKTISVSNALNYFLFSNKLNIGATIQDLETMNLLQILAEPSITAISGQKANFLVGGEFPFPIVSNAGGVANVSISFRPYGVKLEFTPKVNVDGTIELMVAPEVSALDYSNAVTISGYSIPAISTRRAETRVVLNSGQTFAIAGLLDQRETDIFSRTPGIASVPLLGELFKSKSVSHSRQELMVIVTPTLIPHPAAEPGTIVQPAKHLDKNQFDHDLPKSEK
jgi:pilus assembly protein CpaC